MELGRYVDGLRSAKPWKIALAGLAICLVLSATACGLADPASSGAGRTQSQQAATDVSQTAASSRAATNQSQADLAADAKSAEDSKTAADAQATNPAVQTISAEVIRVVDGDTAWLRLSSGADAKVRFIGIDTPESTNEVEPYGKEASAYTHKRLPVGKTVYLEQDVEARDKYGRLLAYVWLEKPSAISRAELRDKLFNAQLAIDGYAQQMTIPPNVKYADYFKDFVAEARSADKGLWSASAASVAKLKAKDPAPAQSKSQSASYIANRNTRKFHYANCSSVLQMNPSNRVPYSSRQKAVADGYIPCKRCNP